MPNNFKPITITLESYDDLLDIGNNMLVGQEGRIRPLSMAEIVQSLVIQYKQRRALEPSNRPSVTEIEQVD